LVAISSGQTTTYHEFVSMLGISFSLLFFQPLGLSSLLLSGSKSLTLFWLGYAAYLYLILVAIRYRQKWQTILLWLALAALITLNLAGCYKSASDFGRLNGM